MSTAHFTKQTGETSAGLFARTAGILYLLIFIAAPSGATTATPAKMAITLACDTGVAFLFYVLFKPVSKRLSFVAAVFRLLFVAVMAVDSLNYFGVLHLFKDARPAATFNTLDGISLVPFGVHCLLIGYLIFKSNFLPRILGVLLALAGLGYLIFLWPPLGLKLFFPYILVPGVVGEGSLTLWLLFIGVNAGRWAEQANSAGMRT